MASRIDYEVTVLTRDADEAIALLREHTDEPRQTQNNGLFTVLYYTNEDGELCGVPDLHEAGIPFDCHSGDGRWDDGDPIEASSIYGRFREDGQPDYLYVMDSDTYAHLPTLMKLIEQPDRLREHLLKLHRRITPLPWDDQDRRSALYKMQRLVDPSFGQQHPQTGTAGIMG